MPNGLTVDQIPPEIAASARCVLWNLELRSGKETKVPYRPYRPAQKAAVDDPDTWGTFAEAVAAWEDGQADGVGVVLGEGLVGVDLDRCRNPKTGVLTEEANSIITALNSYTEISPSGTGVHILLRGALPPRGRRKGLVEIYSDGRYFTVTGAHVSGTPTTIQDRTAALADLHASVFGRDVQSVDVTAHDAGSDGRRLGDDGRLADRQGHEGHERRDVRGAVGGRHVRLPEPQ